MYQQLEEKYVESFMSELIAKNPGEKEFHQALTKSLRVSLAT